jgi:hypothetical protein
VAVAGAQRGNVTKEPLRVRYLLINYGFVRLEGDITSENVTLVFAQARASGLGSAAISAYIRGAQHRFTAVERAMPFVNRLPANI